MVVGILRQYNDAYLSEIGQPGTRGLPVLGVRGGAPCGLLRAAFDFRWSASATPAGVDFGYVKGSTIHGGGEYAHEEVAVSPDPDSSPDALFEGARYAMLDGGATPAEVAHLAGGTAGFPYLRWTGAGDSWGGDGGTALEHRVAVSVSVRGLWSPWWGSLAVPPGHGYAAPEGRWALLAEASALSEVAAPAYRAGAAGATRYVWAYCGERLHRLRGARREFYPSGDGDDDGGWVQRWDDGVAGGIPGELLAWLAAFARSLRFSVRLVAGSGRPD